MADNITISKTELLYDPLFDKKPDLKMKDKKSKIFKSLFHIFNTAFCGYVFVFVIRYCVEEKMCVAS